MQNEIVIATGRVVGVNAVFDYATNKWSLTQFTSTLELDKELDGSNSYVVHEKAELNSEYEFVLRPKDNTPLPPPPPAPPKVPRFFSEEDTPF